MKENGEDWQQQLDTVILEIAGLHEIFTGTPQFLQLLIKLEGLSQVEDIKFKVYRKTVFDCINLLQEVTK